MLGGRASPTGAAHRGAFVVSAAFRPPRAAVLAALRKLVRLFALLVVGAVLVHALEAYVPLCRCIADAVRGTRAYAHLEARLAGTDPVEVAVRTSQAVHRALDEAPTVGEVVTAERRALLDSAWTAARTRAADALGAAADALEPNGAPDAAP